MPENTFWKDIVFDTSTFSPMYWQHIEDDVYQFTGPLVSAGSQLIFPMYNRKKWHL